jgi:multicomponent K+:H+ antiporter subunit A
MAEGAQAIDRMLRLDHRRVIGAGLLIAAGTGAASLLTGAPFLTSAHGEAHVPLLGALPVASAMAFDLGVYLTVVGAVLLTLSTLARPRSAGADAA